MRPSDAIEAPLSPPLHVERVPPDGHELWFGFAEFFDGTGRLMALDMPRFHHSVEGAALQEHARREGHGIRSACSALGLTPVEYCGLRRGSHRLSPDDYARARARLSAVPGPYERAHGAIPDAAGPEPGALTPRRSAP